MSVESSLRRMTKQERVAFLRARGWSRLSKRGTETWFHPTCDEPGGDRGFYSLADAIRTALCQADAGDD